MHKEEAEIFDEATRRAAKKYFAAVGAKGGKKTAERGPEYFREIQKKSVESRRKRKSEQS